MKLMMPSEATWKTGRDILIVGVSLSLAVYEFTHQGRIELLVWLGGLLVSPAFMRNDEARRKSDAEAS